MPVVLSLGLRSHYISNYSLMITSREDLARKAYVYTLIERVLSTAFCGRRLSRHIELPVQLNLSRRIRNIKA